MNMNTVKPGGMRTAPPPAKPDGKTRTASNKSECGCDCHLMDDAAIVSDVLGTQKSLVKLYGTALCEGSNEKIRGLCNTHLTELAEDQFDSFQYMSEHNLYPTDPVEAAKLSEAKQKFKATQTKLKG